MWLADRVDAGRRLGEALHGLSTDRPVVVGLPPGGVPVAREVARILDAPLDVLLVQPLRPASSPAAVGAVGEGVRVVDEDDAEEANLAELEQAEHDARAAIARDSAEWRAGDPPRSLVDRTVVIVDDGLAGGPALQWACRIARAHGAHRVVVATPTGPAGAVDLGVDADTVVSLPAGESYAQVGNAAPSAEDLLACRQAARPGFAPAS